MSDTLQIQGADASQKREKAVSRPPHGRFVTLDGMRGIAALVVVCFHFSLVGFSLTPHMGYLAVDMFFVLSGFVLAYANDKRFASGLTAKEFMQRRLIRLYPLYCAGFALGVLQTFLSVHKVGLHRDEVISIALNAFLLPSFVRSAPGHLITPIVGPAWSLILELWIANLSFALFWRWLRGPILACVIAGGAVGLILTQIAFHTLDVGSMASSALAGLSRVAYSFYVGVWLARIYQSRPPQRALPSALLLIVLAAILCGPVHGLSESIVAFAAILFIFPAMTFWGAGALERKPWMGRELGNLSYAAYVIHVPILYMAAQALGHLHSQPNLEIGAVLIALVTAVSLLAHHVFDEPVRRWLTGLSKKAGSSANPALSTR